MELFVAIIIVLLVIGVVMVVRGGEQALELDRKDRELAGKIQEDEDLLAPHPIVHAVHPLEQTAKRVESWTLDSAENTAADSEGE
jgi:hypothetical protein